MINLYQYYNNTSIGVDLGNTSNVFYLCKLACIITAVPILQQNCFRAVVVAHSTLLWWFDCFQALQYHRVKSTDWTN